MMANNKAVKGPSYTEAIKKVYRTENGLRGFYKGWFPPLCGNMVTRSLQFSIYEVFYNFSEKYKALHQPVPFTGGIPYRVVLGGMCSGVVRAIFETPFEYVKVKK